MRGQILEFDEVTGEGALIDSDGRRYTFKRTDWKGDGSPPAGGHVTFAGDLGFARTIRPGSAEGAPAPVGDRSFAWLWFSFAGRATRSDFWLRYFVIVMPISVAAFFIDRELGSRFRPSSTVSIITSVVFLWPALAVQIKRLHDRNMTSAHIVIMYIASAGLWIMTASATRRGGYRSSDSALLEIIFTLAYLAYALYLFVHMGFLRGTEGTNRFGHDPLDTRLKRS